MDQNILHPPADDGLNIFEQCKKLGTSNRELKGKNEILENKYAQSKRRFIFLTSILSIVICIGVGLSYILWSNGYIHAKEEGMYIEVSQHEGSIIIPGSPYAQYLIKAKSRNNKFGKTEDYLFTVQYPIRGDGEVICSNISDIGAGSELSIILDAFKYMSADLEN